MKQKKQLSLLFVLFFCFTFSQQDSITNLDEVVIDATKKLKNNSKSYKVLSLKDSVLVTHSGLLGSLLRYYTPLYLKEYGNGGVSSVSFRGTSTSGTAVLWNGININSINNAQTDFNSVEVALNDEISVRSGGGSIEYGSGAIGGTVHIFDNLKFSNKTLWRHQVVALLGSFLTTKGLYKLKYSDDSFAFNLGGSIKKSTNDYPLVGTKFRNQNGAYSNASVNLSLAYRLSENWIIQFFSNSFYGNRLLSGELPNPTNANDRYKDFTNRNLTSFIFHKNKWELTSRIAYLFQEYRFFSNKNLSKYSFGSSDRVLFDLTADYQCFDGASISSITKLETIFGRTDKMRTRNRKELSQSLIFKHNVRSFFSYNAKLRKDFNSDYDVPISYAFGFKLLPLPKSFLRANASANYRVPSYNDLYWPEQGNENLIPETSKQWEVGLGYQTKQLFFDIAYFSIQSKDKIVWTPNGNPEKPGVWSPINVEQTESKGLESSIKFHTKFLSDLDVSTMVNYSYTLAKNKKTDKFLPFVPKHLANATLQIKLYRFGLDYQQLFADAVFTTSSNAPYYKVDSYFVSNISANYTVFSNVNDKLIVGAQFNNIFNTAYHIVQNRPMPGINYNLNLNYKF